MTISNKAWGYATIVVIAVLGQALPVPDSNRSIPLILFALQLGFFLALSRPLILVMRKHPEPTAQLVRDVREYWPWLLGTVLVYVSLALALELGTGIKKSIPVVNPFQMDPLLIELDRWVFGTDPWKLTHALLGWATGIIDVIYIWWQVVQIGLALLIAFSFDEWARIRFALIFQLTWLLNGGLLATLMSSVGPVMAFEFYGDRSFLPLVEKLGDEAPRVIGIKNMLIGTMDDPTVVSGISAMPSMHVAICIIFALWVANYQKTILTAAAWSYAALIYLGSVHLGWHYASDGVVSLIVVLAIWWTTGKFVDFLRRRDGAVTA